MKVKIWMKEQKQVSRIVFKQGREYLVLKSLADRFIAEGAAQLASEPRKQIEPKLETLSDRQPEEELILKGED